jgi:hemerythrin-like domain-containing protein
MSEVMRVLRREHANIATLVKTLDRQTTALASQGEADFEILRDAMDWFLSFPDVYHHPKEDLLFSRLRLRDPEAAARIGDLRKMHEELAHQSRTAAEAIRRMLAEYPTPRQTLVDLVRQFIAMQVAHMRMEEDRLFPACAAALTAADWHDLEVAMRDEQDPLLGDVVDAHFERLRRTILTWQAEDERIGG